MKTAFRVILACLLAAPALNSCHEDSDYLYGTYYTYRNEGSSEVILTSYFGFDEIQGDSTFVLPVNQKYTLLFIARGNSCVPPFFMQGYPIYSDSLVITNGKCKVVQRPRDKESHLNLYDLTNYELVSEGRHEKSYLYTFTDSFFDQGEPLSP